MTSTVKCPACARDNPGGRFCAWCAAPLDGTSAETELMPSSVPRLSSTSSVDEGRFLPGTVLAGRYRVAGLLGRGGMGEVYRATDLTLGQAVALKFLPEALARDERALARFYNEVRVARQVTHPNVCRVYDIGQVDGLHYISMEFVDGEDLSSLLRRIGRLPVDKATETARKLCAGLAAAHERGVLHRDLKPANVMIDSRGQVIIMDFGLAGLTDQLQADVRSGTPAYMSPEQLAGTEVSAKSDIYALGLVLYELFTGKRAFEAGSLVELMDLQQRGSPMSITSVVKDLDPAVERIILRCLAPDPKQRPASALGIAAALPGGDPLAAALAAGETPSPELVAAAGETDGLQPRFALACLAAAVAGLLVVAAFAPAQQITEKLHFENPPEALARDSRTLLQSLGYTTRPADAAWGFDYDGEYRDYLKQHKPEAVERWKNPGAGEPSLVTFWYRESPSPLVVARRFSVQLSFQDPPFENGGMLRLLLNPDGKLRQLDAVPPKSEAPAPPGNFDWNKLFQAAGLEQDRYQPAEPQWTPPVSWDQRGAWTAGPLRVEAAAWRGRPVFFRVIGPWTDTGKRNTGARTGQIVTVAIIYTLLLSACVLAWVNFRAKKVDLRGATRLGLCCWAGYASASFLNIHHVALVDEIANMWEVLIGNAAINGGAAWVFYLALEPWVRRRWPRTMITWSRFVVKGFGDPLVGRDLLYGVGLGALTTVVDVIHATVRDAATPPYFPNLSALMGVIPVLAGVLVIVGNSFISPCIDFFLLFLCRVLFRREWLAVVVFIGFIVVLAMASGSTARDLPFTLIGAAIEVAVLLRFGLLAAMVVQLTENLLGSIHTLDLSAWFAGATTVPVVLLVALAIYGFRVSLAGRKLIQLPE